MNKFEKMPTMPVPEKPVINESEAASTTVENTSENVNDQLGKETESQENLKKLASVDVLWKYLKGENIEECDNQGAVFAYKTLEAVSRTFGFCTITTGLIKGGIGRYCRKQEIDEIMKHLKAQDLLERGKKTEQASDPVAARMKKYEKLLSKSKYLSAEKRALVIEKMRRLEENYSQAMETNDENLSSDLAVMADSHMNDQLRQQELAKSIESVLDENLGSKITGEQLAQMITNDALVAGGFLPMRVIANAAMRIRQSWTQEKQKKENEWLMKQGKAREENPQADLDLIKQEELKVTEWVYDGILGNARRMFGGGELKDVTGKKKAWGVLLAWMQTVGTASVFMSAVGQGFHLGSRGVTESVVGITKHLQGRIEEIKNAWTGTDTIKDAGSVIAKFLNIGDTWTRIAMGAQKVGGLFKKGADVVGGAISTHFNIGSFLGGTAYAAEHNLENVPVGATGPAQELPQPPSNLPIEAHVSSEATADDVQMYSNSYVGTENVGSVPTDSATLIQLEQQYGLEGGTRGDFEKLTALLAEKNPQQTDQVQTILDSWQEKGLVGVAEIKKGGSVWKSVQEIIKGDPESYGLKVGASTREINKAVGALLKDLSPHELAVHAGDMVYVTIDGDVVVSSSHGGVKHLEEAISSVAKNGVSEVLKSEATIALSAEVTPAPSNAPTSGVAPKEIEVVYGDDMPGRTLHAEGTQLILLDGRIVSALGDSDGLHFREHFDILTGQEQKNFQTAYDYLRETHNILVRGLINNMDAPHLISMLNKFGFEVDPQVHNLDEVRHNVAVFLENNQHNLQELERYASSGQVHGSLTTQIVEQLKTHSPAEYASDVWAKSLPHEVVEAVPAKGGVEVVYGTDTPGNTLHPEGEQLLFPGDKVVSKVVDLDGLKFRPGFELALAKQRELKDYFGFFTKMHNSLASELITNSEGNSFELSLKNLGLEYKLDESAIELLKNRLAGFLDKNFTSLKEMEEYAAHKIATAPNLINEPIKGVSTPEQYAWAVLSKTAAQVADMNPQEIKAELAQLGASTKIITHKN